MTRWPSTRPRYGWPAHRPRRSYAAFTRNNVQHPTYKAPAELGKAVKTIFLCRYLHEAALRREIHEGLDVIEHWNGANDFVFFGKRGDLASNDREDNELSMLALHLLQNCMVYINTLMLQQILGQPDWRQRLTAVDRRAHASDLGPRQPLWPLRAPFFGWLYGPLSVHGVSIVFGVFEVADGIAIAPMPVFPMVSAAGSAFTIVMLLSTLSFLKRRPASPRVPVPASL